MKVRLETCILQRAPEPATFSLAIRTQPISEGTVGCQGERRAAASCGRCPHYLNTPSDHEVRCLFLDTDTVETIMTPANQVQAVDIRELRSTPSRQKPRQLVLTEDGKAIALVASHGRGRTRQRPIPVVPRTTSLATAAAIVRLEPALVVVDRDELVGIVTRGDLRRAGVPLAGE